MLLTVSEQCTPFPNQRDVQVDVFTSENDVLCAATTYYEVSGRLARSLHIQTPPARKEK